MSTVHVPESVMKQLVIGQRVRYIMSDIPCNYQPQANSHAGRYGALEHEAYFDAVDKTGTIVEVSNEAHYGHPLVVRLNYTFGGRAFTAIHAATHEVILVEEE